MQKIAYVTLALAAGLLGGCGSSSGAPPCTGSACNATGGTTGGTGGSGGPTTGSPGGPPALTVVGNKLQDPSGKTVVLRGASLIDLGSVYTYQSSVADRIDQVIAAGVQGNVVRLPIYPKINYNGSSPYCSPLPYPVGTGPASSCTPHTPADAATYDNMVLKPAVDYATSKGLYVIIDFHQIDNATTGTSAADANTFWADVAPKFASYPNVIYEAFNEPMDLNNQSWSALKPVAQQWINTIRAGAPNNIIIVPSSSYCQHPGDAASDPPSGSNLMFTAHIYPQNWNGAFMQQLSTAIAKAPVFITEWGYTVGSGNRVDYTSSASWGTSFQSVVDGDGASWTAWVADNAWTPSLFKDADLTQLTDFGSLVKSWLAAH